MYSKIGVTSSDCGLCSVCKNTDNISKMKRVAANEVKCQQNDREYAVRALLDLETKCMCRKPGCKGRDCVTRSKSCHKCFGTNCKGIKHYSSCKFNNPKINNACVYCWLPQSLRRSNKNEVHGRGKCVHAERIKKVMLYGCNNGEDAHNDLYLCWDVEEDWIEIFVQKHKKMLNK